MPDPEEKDLTDELYGSHDEQDLTQELMAAPDAQPEAPTGHDPFGDMASSMLTGAADGATAGLGQNVDAIKEFARSRQAANPGAYGTGQAIGSFALPAVKGIKAAGALAKFGSHALAGGINSGLEAGARGFSEADGGWLDKLEAGGSAALKGAATGFGLGGVLGSAADGASAVQKSFAKKADLNRVAATGLYGAQLRNLMQNKGDQYVQDLGRKIEEKGLHKGSGALGFLPQPAATYADNASALETNALGRMKGAESAIDELPSPPMVNTSDITNDLRKDAAKAAGSWDPAGETESNFRNQMADRIDNGSHEVMGSGQKMAEWGNALQQRRGIDKQIDWNRRGGFEDASMKEQVRRQVAGDLRSNISSSLDQGVERGTVPENLSNDWKGGRDDYALAAAVKDPAMARVFQEYGNQKISLPGFISGAGGIATGNPIAGMAAAAGGQLIKTRGASALAGAQRGISAASNVAGAPLRAAESMTPGAVGLMAGSQDDKTPVQLASESKVDRYPDAAMALEREDGSKLGRWRPQMLEAMKSPNYREDLQKLIDRLEVTDPEFRSKVLPEIQRRSLK